MFNKYLVWGLALTGSVIAVSSVAWLQYARRWALLLDKQDMRIWEGEGGSLAPLVATPKQAG
jgi:hypothetical protein